MKRLRHKFGAVRTERNGRSYASKAEARYADRLAVEQHAGTVHRARVSVPSGATSVSRPLR